MDMQAMWQKIARVIWMFIFSHLEIFIESMAADIKVFIMSEMVDGYVDDIQDPMIQILARNGVQLIRDYVKDLNPDDIIPLM